MSHVGTIAVRSTATAVAVIALVLGGYAVARTFAPDNSGTAESPQVPTTLEELVRFAGSNDGPVDLIAIGRVAAVDREGDEPLRVPSALGTSVPRPVFPYTDLLVQIDEVLAGDSAGSQVRLREPGHLSAAHSASSWPMPRVGQRMIFLFNLHPSGEYYTTHPYAEIDLSGSVPVLNDAKRTPVTSLHAPAAPADLAREIARIARSIRQ